MIFKKMNNEKKKLMFLGYFSLLLDLKPEISRTAGKIKCSRSTPGAVLVSRFDFRVNSKSFCRQKKKKEKKKKINISFLQKGATPKKKKK